ncbi:hypothetical protein HanPI659440_Chr02g0045061 [Helianthus annuus]|nr:hypothetical protein HanPI659440_Chr02g0045061 [Helianthus annuus]
MEKKRSILADTKRKLDTEAALNVSEKKRKLMGQPVGPAPSESDVDLSVFRKKSFIILDDLYEESARRKGSAKATGLRSRRSTSRGSKPSALDISLIPSPESPPAAVFGDSPARDPFHPDDGKGKGPEEVVRSAVAEKFNAEKKGLNWRVSNVEEKLAKEQKHNTESQEEWTAACARSNRDLKLPCDEVIKLKGERDEASQKVMRLTASLKDQESQVAAAFKAHEEAQLYITELEKVVEDHKPQAKAS